MDREAKRNAFNVLRCQLLRGKYEFRRHPLVWIFERSPTLIVCFALQVAAFEEGPDLAPHDRMLETMVQFDHSLEVV